MPVRTRAQSRADRAIAIIAAAWRNRAKPREDPIMLAPIERPWKHVDGATGVVTWFDANSLAQYIASEGNTLHPLTRVPFTQVEIRRLQNASRVDLEGALRRHRTRPPPEAAAVTGLDEFLESDLSRVVQAMTDEALAIETPVADALMRCRLRHAGLFNEAAINLHRVAPSRVRGACDRALADIGRAGRAAHHDAVVHWAEHHVRDVHARLLILGEGRRGSPILQIPHPSSPPPPPRAAQEPHFRRNPRSFRRPFVRIVEPPSAAAPPTVSELIRRIISPPPRSPPPRV